jgi:hypothetical protein
MLPTIRHIVPTIAGRIPPLVIPSSGIEVRNFQLIAEAPRITINPRIINKSATTIRLIILKELNAKV